MITSPREDKRPSAPRLGWRRGALISALLWLVYAGVHHDEPGWNVNSRFALTRAIVDKGTFVVDGYVDRPGRDFYTEDRSIRDGRYYSDKIIGTSLLGLPAYAAARAGAWAMGIELSPAAARYLTTIGSVSVCAALAGAVMASLLMAMGATLAEAFLLAIALSFGTLLWGYATLFASYLPAVMFSLVAWNTLLRARLDGGVGPGAMALAGLALGGALLCEYTTGMIALVMGLYGLWHGRPRWSVVWLGASAAVVLSVFAAYTLVCFGEVCIPYKYLENRLFAEGMGEGLQGVKRFSWRILAFVTVHPYRGLFVLSPVLALSFPGMILMARRAPRLRSDALVCAVVFFAYLAFNSSYYMWWGGWTMGPRHLAPALPFMIPPLLWVFRWHWAGAAMLGVTLAASIWLVGVPALVDPQVPQGYPWPLLIRPELAWEHVRVSPVFHECWPAFFEGGAAWNEATVAALRGPAYFLILAGVWAAAGAWVIFTSRREQARAQFEDESHFSAATELPEESNRTQS